MQRYKELCFPADNCPLNCVKQRNGAISFVNSFRATHGLAWNARKQPKNRVLSLLRANWQFGPGKHTVCSGQTFGLLGAKNQSGNAIVRLSSFFIYQTPCSVKPKTRYAFCEQGLPTTCPKIGMENESVTLMSFVAFSATLVTAKPVVP